MKIISDYTIYCTPEQTKKALELGAPIEILSGEAICRKMVKYAKDSDLMPELEEDMRSKNCTVIGELAYKLPTAEQMIGWLEEQFIGSIEITFDNPPIKWKYESWNKNFTLYEYEAGFSSRKEATLAAIDAALEYLVTNKLLE